MTAVLEVFEDPAGAFRFQLKEDNGQIVAQSEPYDTEAEAVAACQMLQATAAGATTAHVEPVMVNPGLL